MTHYFIIVTIIPSINYSEIAGYVIAKSFGNPGALMKLHELKIIHQHTNYWGLLLHE